MIDPMRKNFFAILKRRHYILTIIAMALIVVVSACNNSTPIEVVKPANVAAAPDSGVYVPPDTSTIPHDQFGDMVRYGRDLIVNTAYYLGPNGTVGHYLGNKMNCANCHIDAGTRPFGFNYFSTHARYPQYRGRENEVLDLGGRINNCVERPHNGRPLPLGSREIVAMECYIKWLSTNVSIGHHVKGDESLEIELPDRAADVQKGAAIFATECTSCHGTDGAGKFNADSSTYIYPPLWGPNAYQNGSSPSRVVKLARFIKANMPDKKATWEKPYLTDEQAIDVAAFINDGELHPRPQKKNKEIPDYSDVKMKAYDYETGPYVDSFPAQQHKYGPYKPIIKYLKEHSLPVTD
jgi:thiosulfate dehydrogenase